jgi:hypothetical protein
MRLWFLVSFQHAMTAQLLFIWAFWLNAQRMKDQTASVKKCYLGLRLEVID